MGPSIQRPAHDFQHRRCVIILPHQGGQHERKQHIGKFFRSELFGKGIRPNAAVAVQNADTKEVILVAYTNEYAMKESFAKRKLILWSTSRNKLWFKGETSGETFDLLEAYVNCEQNSLLYIVRPCRGGICHTKNKLGAPRNCYYRKIDFETLKLTFVDP